jgi:hypothetical protein
MIFMMIIKFITSYESLKPDKRIPVGQKTDTLSPI